MIYEIYIAPEVDMTESFHCNLSMFYRMNMSGHSRIIYLFDYFDRFRWTTV